MECSQAAMSIFNKAMVFAGAAYLGPSPPKLPRSPLAPPLRKQPSRSRPRWAILPSFASSSVADDAIGRITPVYG